MDLPALSRHKIDHLVRALFVEFSRIGVCQPQNIPGKFNDRDLHPQTDPQVGDLVFTGVFCGQDHSLDPAVSKPAWNDDPVQSAQDPGCRFPFDRFRIDPVDPHKRIQSIARMVHCLRHRQIRVMELYVFAHQADMYLL